MAWKVDSDMVAVVVVMRFWMCWSKWKVQKCTLADCLFNAESTVMPRL